MMITDTILHQLTEGTVLEGPHWTEPVKVLTAKARGSRIEVQAVGMHTRRLWTKLLKPEEFDGAIKATSAGALAALDGNPTHFRLAAEAHRIRLAFQYDPPLCRLCIASRPTAPPDGCSLHASAHPAPYPLLDRR